jgi:Zn-dependent peptidase ImmA (M78 family)
MVKMKTLTQTRWNLVRQRAAELTRPYSAPPIPVAEIAERNGVQVVFGTFGEFSDKIAGYCDFSESKIVVNDDDNHGRKMFTVAHEFGHWILHREFFVEHPENYAVLPRFQAPAQNSFEQEANFFAAEILAPAKLLRPVKNAGVARLAALFGVSREMMEFRLRNV